jgi:hypothetical protein
MYSSWNCESGAVGPNERDVREEEKETRERIEERKENCSDEKGKI